MLVLIATEEAEEEEAAVIRTTGPGSHTHTHTQACVFNQAAMMDSDVGAGVTSLPLISQKRLCFFG